MCNVLFSVIYRPPTGSIESFLNFVEKSLERSLDSRLQTVLVGDFNINVSLDNPSYVCLNELIEAYGCMNVISTPTRITAALETTLDLCITSFDTADVKAGAITTDISDHFPTYCFLPGNRVIKSKDEMLFRSYSSRNIKLENFISGIDWSTVIEERDPNKSYNIFLKHLTSLYDACFPLKPCKKHRKCRKPWVTVELYNRIKVKNNLFQVFLSSRDENDLRNFKKFCNTLNKDLKIAKTEYYISKFTTHSGDGRLLWDTINQLINKKEISRRIKFEKLGMSKLEIADTFNKYFLTVGEFTTDSTETCCENYIASNYPSSVFLFPTDQQEVVKLITSLKDNCACGPDDIKPKPLKAISHIIATPLTHIYNLMLSSGVFPDQMKLAKVTAIHKGGSFD